jgi:hypothetical protein
MPDRADIDAAIATLLRHAGMLMEDASVAAVSLPPADAAAATRRITALVATGADIAALTAAAGVLIDKSPMP